MDADSQRRSHALDRLSSTAGDVGRDLAADEGILSSAPDRVEAAIRRLQDALAAFRAT
jgi:hypothetical protein